MNRKICVVGLGYVGLPVAVAFGLLQPIIGFDINPTRVTSLQQNIDYTGEVTEEELEHSQIEFTINEEKIKECDFVIIAVPTPINNAKIPDLSYLINSSTTVGKYLAYGAIVVYESTVYPGATEEVCIPILEQYSGLICGKDFYVGYSPERINPGDRLHSFKNIVKVVSAIDENTTSIIRDVYSRVIDADIFCAPSIKVAEAAKVIENTQRDLNIALVNELAIIFDRLNIDTFEVLKAAGTKWNFLNFTPGLVGGHCIGVDPYYLTYKAESVGYHPQVILAGRRINDGMGQFIAYALLKKMILEGIVIQGSTVAVLGVTFKENVPDIRNSRVIDIINELEDFGIEVLIVDPIANISEVKEEYGKSLTPFEMVKEVNAVVLAVSHQEFIQMGWKGVTSLLINETGIVIDVKSVLDPKDCPNSITMWRL